MSEVLASKIGTNVLLTVLDSKSIQGVDVIQIPRYSRHLPEQLKLIKADSEITLVELEVLFELMFRQIKQRYSTVGEIKIPVHPRRALKDIAISYISPDKGGCCYVKGDLSLLQLECLIQLVRIQPEIKAERYHALFERIKPEVTMKRFIVIGNYLHGSPPAIRFTATLKEVAEEYVGQHSELVQWCIIDREQSEIIASNIPDDEKPIFYPEALNCY